MPPVIAPIMAMSPAEIEAFCRRNHIRRLSLFGSVLTERFRPDSDIDILVEFEPGSKVSLFDIAGMELELTEKLGRKEDRRDTKPADPRVRGSPLVDRLEYLNAGVARVGARTGEGFRRDRSYPATPLIYGLKRQLFDPVGPNWRDEKGPGGMWPQQQVSGVFRGCFCDPVPGRTKK